MVSTVGVFVNPRADELEAVLERVPLDVVQFHGDESPKQCARSSRPWMKAVAMRDDVDLLECASRYADARALLLDTFSAAGQRWHGSNF